VVTTFALEYHMGSGAVFTVEEEEEEEVEEEVVVVIPSTGGPEGGEGRFVAPTKAEEMRLRKLAVA